MKLNSEQAIWFTPGWDGVLLARRPAVVGLSSRPDRPSAERRAQVLSRRPRSGTGAPSPALRVLDSASTVLGSLSGAVKTLSLPTFERAVQTLIQCLTAGRKSNAPQRPPRHRRPEHQPGALRQRRQFRSTARPWCPVIKPRPVREPWSCPAVTKKSLRQANGIMVSVLDAV
jgi:hypothetical protein